MFGEPGKYERHRPNEGDLNAGIVQVATESIGGWLWRPVNAPGVWYQFGAPGLVEVPETVWRRFVPNAEQELAARKRQLDRARVQGLIDDATRGPSTQGEERGGYFLRELPGGLATVHAADGGRAMHGTPLPTAVAQGILDELAGTAEQQENDA